MQYRIAHWFTTSDVELKDLLKAWAAISLAFTIVNTGLSLSPAVIGVFIMSAITVGLGFLVHELGHKIMAQRYGCWAEFRADDRMLFMAIVFSLFGFVFAAPGAVIIAGRINVRKNGIISMMGPLMNLILAAVFLVLIFTGIFPTIAKYGFLINTWIGLFNMIPFGNFDGIKILRWNRLVYGVMVAAALALMMAAF